jgi:UPF0755 protein
VKFFSFLFLIALTVGGGWYWYQMALSPVAPGSAQRIPLTIEEGSGLKIIAQTLHEKSVIRSPLAFTLYVKKKGLESSLQAGDYVLSPADDVPEIAAALQGGRSKEEKITIPEGYTVAQIDKLMAEKGFGEAGDILDCAFKCDFSSFEFLPTQNFGELERGYGSKPEGYLFLGTFRARVVNELDADIKASGRDLHEITTMASLIEEETRTDDERLVVSGILWKRFDAETGLGVDATVRYVLRNISDALTAQDLQIDSPYNTRKYRGLPPGPIANAGLPSIKAALRPEDSPYWYYLHGSDGQIRYGETNDEHNANKAKYLR